MNHDLKHPAASPLSGDLQKNDSDTMATIIEEAFRKERFNVTELKAEIEDLKETLKRYEYASESAQWHIRALGGFIACQEKGIIPPQYTGSWTSFCLAVMMGNSASLIEANKAFVDQVVKLTEKAESNGPA